MPDPNKTYIGLDDDQNTLQLGQKAKKEFIGLPEPAPDITQGRGFEQASRETVAPFLGRAAAESLPVAGSYLLGPGGGTMAGTIASNILRNASPEIFGQPHNTPLGFAGDVGLNILGQDLLPAAATGIANLARKGAVGLVSSGLLKNFPAVREGIVKTLSEQVANAYRVPETQAIEQGAGAAKTQLGVLKQNIQNATPFNLQTPGFQSSPQLLAAKQALEDAFGKNKIGSKLLKLQDELQEGVDVAKSQTYKDISSNALNDVTSVNNWKLATGDPHTIDSLATNQLLTNNFKESEKILNGKALLDQLGGAKKEIYEAAINPQKLDDLKSFASALMDQEKSHIMDRVVNYSNGHLLWVGLPLLAGGEHVLGGIGTAAGAVSITNSMLRRLMDNPQTAKLVTQAVLTPSNAPQAVLLNRALSGVIKGLSGTAIAAGNQ